MSFGKTVNLGNSIIGVSILAMPYCFVQSGVLLSILLIVLSGLLTRLSCYFLLKSSIIARRRSFELIVQDVLGSTGRLMVELGLTGFLLGTCVAYFIMIGDLAPKIISEQMNINYSINLRMATVIFLSVFVALPLCLLRKVDSLTSFSVLSMLIYTCLIVKLMFETNDMLVRESSLDKDGGGSEVNRNEHKIIYWNISGLLTTFPIYSMAMSCQTSLFEIFDSSVIHSDTESIKRDNRIIEKAIYLCSFVYLTVGLLGYMAFHEQTLYGNLLLAFHPSLTTTLTKIGFIITLLMSFPLCVFPCRTSVYSLTVGRMKKSGNFYQLGEDDGGIGECDRPNNNHASINTHTLSQFPTSKQYISDFHFRLLTVILIAVTVLLSLMIPNIEFILGIIGSTAGTTVCFILPAYTFIRIGQHSKTELFLARLLLVIGINMLVFCTYSTILSLNPGVPIK